MSEGVCRTVVRITLIAGFAALLSCAKEASIQPQSSVALGELGAEESAAAPLTSVLSTEDWAFGDYRGSVIRTAHYRVYTTESDPILVDRLSFFLEYALAHYRSALTPLPTPSQRLDTYLMDNRPQWVTLTKRLMGTQSEQLTQIQRGGFASRGIGVFYDLGLYDTLAIAAHEGWHQYTQRTFEDPLPVWLEEGLATYMEGHRWTGTTPVFRPWANIERFDQLRLAAAGRSLMSLDDLLEARPQAYLGNASDQMLTYYAQLWALVHFLNSGEDARYATGLRTLLADAASGRLRRVLSGRIGDRAAAAVLQRRAGRSVFDAYFQCDVVEFESGYFEFVQKLVRPGSREAVAAGQAPDLN